MSKDTAIPTIHEYDYWLSFKNQHLHAAVWQAKQFFGPGITIRKMLNLIIINQHLHASVRQAKRLSGPFTSNEKTFNCTEVR